MITLLCHLSLALQCIGCSQSTYSNVIYPAPGATSVELDTTDYLYVKQPSYQNDDYAVEKYEKPEEPVPYLSTIYFSLRKCRLLSSFTSFSMILVLMLRIHDICSDPKMQLPLAFIGLLIAVPMIFEMSLTLVGFMDICDGQCKVEKDRALINSIKTIFNLFIVGLQLTRMFAMLTTDQPHKSVAEELCTWKGDTLFTSEKWVGLVFTPTLLLIVIPIVEILIGYLFPDYPSEQQRKKPN